MYKQLVDTQAQLGKTLVAAYQNEAKLAEAGGIVQALEARAVSAEAQLADSLKAFDLAKHCLEQTEKNLARTMESLVSTQERRVSAEQLLAHTQNHVVEIQQAQEQTLGRLSAALDRGQALERALIEAQHEKARVEIAVAHAQEVVNTTRDALLRSQDALVMTQEAWAADRARLAETQDRIARIQELTIERDDLYRSALDREQELRVETAELRKKLERIESHAVLGVALKGRRQIKQIWLKFRHLDPRGVIRTTRIDRPS
jgi:chromosome segregation ATPase